MHTYCLVDHHCRKVHDNATLTSYLNIISFLFFSMRNQTTYKYEGKTSRKNVSATSANSQKN